MNYFNSFTLYCIVFISACTKFLMFRGLDGLARQVFVTRPHYGYWQCHNSFCSVNMLHHKIQKIESLIEYEHSRLRLRIYTGITMICCSVYYSLVGHGLNLYIIFLAIFIFWQRWTMPEIQVVVIVGIVSFLIPTWYIGIILPCP